ncbi:phage integrase SAM-like domain-containing protein [Parabacteroides sp. APC149_11_2_Y6]
MSYVSVKVKRRKSVYEDRRMPLYVQIIYKRKVRKVSLLQKLSAKEWDEEKSRVSVPENVTLQRKEELSILQEQLDSMCLFLHREKERLDEKGILDIESIAASCAGYFRAWSLSAYVEKMVEETRKRGKVETARHYQSTLNAFMRFREKKELPLKNLNEAVLKSFEIYLFNRELSGNTVSFYLRNLRAIWNRAIKDGLVKSNPSLFKNVYLRVEKTKKRAVQENIIRKLETLSLGKEEGLILARDLFLFCYYARGMTFVDLAFLRYGNIRNDKIVYKRHKTGQELSVRLLPVMKKLINRYRNPESDFLFPILKGKTPNFHEYESAIRLQNKRLRKLGKLLGVTISTYVARHTWASVAKQKGISDELISESMGHTSLKTTRIYIKLLDTTRLDDANEIVILGKSNYSKKYGRGRSVP